MQSKRSRATQSAEEPQQATGSVGLPYAIAPDSPLEETLRLQSLRLEALRQIEQSLSSELDLEGVLLAIISYSIELTGGSGGGFFIRRPEQDLLEWVTAVGMDPSPVGFTLHRGEGLVGKVWQSGRTLIVNNYPEWEGRYACEAEIPYTAVIGVPVRWKQELLGVLTVVGKPPHTFSPTDQESLELFTPLAAMAIRNASLCDDLWGWMKELHEIQQRLLHAANMTSMGVLAGGIAHQVRNPLAVISTSAQLLADHPEDENLRRQCIQKICAATERASQIIGTILRYARPQNERMAAVDLAAVLNDTLRLLEYELTIRGIALAGEIGPDLAPVHGNATGLQQVFLNLTLNAIHTMPKGGTLTVTAQVCRAGEVEICFRDTSGGIPAQDLPQLFEPFFATGPAGRGPGLSLSYSIIRQHGGTIEVESQEGRGSVYTVRLPCLTQADSDQVTAPSQQSRPAPTAAAARAGSPRRGTHGSAHSHPSRRG